jgi:hypothetical protein
MSENIATVSLSLIDLYICNHATGCMEQKLPDIDCMMEKDMLLFRVGLRNIIEQLVKETKAFHHGPIERHLIEKVASFVSILD